MTNVIGDWPSNWDAVEVDADPDVKESQSDGEDGVRVIPDHLADVDDVGNGEAAAVLVRHVEEQLGPGEQREYWNVAIQSQHGIIGEKGKRGYKTQWEESELSENQARDKIDAIVDDLESVDQLSDVPYLNI